MEETTTHEVPDVSESSGRRLPHPRRWLTERPRSREPGSSFGFSARLVATVLLTFAVIGVTGYVVLERDLVRRQITEYAGVQRADGKAFEVDAARGVSKAVSMSDINRLLDAVVQRPGALAAFLIDEHHVVRAAANDAFVGTFDVAPLRVDAVLKGGSPYAGRAIDPAQDSRDMEFVIPVNLPSGRYAYEVIYYHVAYDGQLYEMRRLIGLVGLLALIGGGAVFYLVGGRRLMRDHRMVVLRSTRDGLTDLPNQRAFQDEFPEAVAAAARYGDTLALALLDVDDFKLINDRQGHPQGDLILKRVSEVLRDVRPGDRPYRIGGDEFALLLAHTDAEGVGILAGRLCGKLADAGIKVSVGVSALRPGLQADTLLAEADAALYETKRHGGNGYARFDDVGEHLVVSAAEKKEAVRRLIEEGRLTTVFQPIWNIGAETLLGVEALARPDPSYGLSGPAEAFDIAEQIGRVHQLDVLFLENALKFAHELEPGVLLFVNLSPLTLDLDAEADPWLGPAVEQAGLSPQAVVVEVTERFGGRIASVVKRLERLRHQGFKIAVDDVGTGNSGLEMLRKIKAEFVKIDRSIVSAAATEPGALAVLVAMAAFARQTGAFVIAEGIEDEETLKFLRTIDYPTVESGLIIQGGQGFGLGRPSPYVSAQPPDILRSGSLIA